MECTQRNAAHIITGNYRSTTPGSVARLLKKTKRQPLQECHHPLCLTLPVWLVVVVPALPPDQFLTTQNPGSLIRAQQQPDCITTNTIGDYIRNNNTDNILPRCNKDQLRNSFFVKTATNWSLEMESPGQRHHPRRLCSVYQPHTSRPPMHSPYSG